ncbi:MAG: hypothetical protein CMM58_02435 [Rhodospirillaceae bacterium]|nr:hypothetical protein [Rhodospirillaceae bacterium]
MTATTFNELRDGTARAFSSPPQGEADPMSPDNENVAIGSTKKTVEFKDFIDVINPLQHLPIVSTVYRAVSGDKIGEVPKFLGGALYGGPAGLIIALGNYITNSEMGSEIQNPGKNAFHNNSRNNSGLHGSDRADYSPKINPSFDEDYRTTTKFSLVDASKPNKFFHVSTNRKNKVFKLTSTATHSTVVQPAPPSPSPQINKNTAGRATGFSEESGEFLSPPAPYFPDYGSGTPKANANVEQWVLQTLGKYEKLRSRQITEPKH